MSQPSADDDATFIEIVANFGDQPDLPLDDIDVEETPQTWWTPDADEGHYEPPAPPPVPVPQGLRGLAWIGLLGAPLALVLLALLRIAVPNWTFTVLGLAFVASLIYLVATMSRKGPSDRDLWDDGSRL